MFAVAADGNGACFSLTFGTVAWCIIRTCIQYAAGACSYTGRCVVYTDPKGLGLLWASKRNGRVS